MFNIGITRGLEKQITRALDLFERLVNKHCATRATIKGGMFMYVVKADNPDVNYTIVPPTATDSEGNEISNADLSYNVTSTNETVVSLVPDSDDNQLTGVIHFGSPSGTEAVSVMVEVTHKGNIVGAFGAQFVVTPGDVSAITGGGIIVDGIEEIDDNPPDEDDDM